MFIDQLPILDLHGYDRESARVAINDFINDQKKMKKPFGAIIHGVGTGILRAATKDTLKNNKNVADFKLANNNWGCTILQIKV